MPDLEKLRFLWEKWKYHDDLMYQRARTVLAVQGALVGLVAALLHATAQAATWGWLIVVLAGALGAAATLFVLAMFQGDRRVRNSFNPVLVKELKAAGLDGGRNLDDAKWDAGDHDHPVNLWHTDQPLKSGTVQASRHLQRLFYLFVAMDLAAVIAAGAYGVILLCHCRS